MKTTWKIFMFLYAAMFMLASCTEDTMDPLGGTYIAPEVYDFNILESNNRVKDDKLYLFTINLKDESENTLIMKFVGTDYILSASDYTPSTTAVKKTYLSGADGSTCNGQQISSGTISLAKQDSNFTMSGILYLADETVVKMTGAFTIDYQPDPYIPTYTYEVETETPALGGSQGTTPINGATKHKISVYADNEFFAYLEVIADENASSISGTYTIKDGIDAIGQITNGFYLDWSWWGGAGIMEGGSYYVVGGDKMFLRQGEGDITIVDNSGTLTITGSNLGILDVETLIASSGSTWTTLAIPGSLNIVNATLKSSGSNSFTYVNTITAPATYGFAGTVIDGSQLNVIKIVNATNDTVAVFELISAEGATDLSGDYSVLDGTSTAMTIGNANNGAYIDWSWWGMGNAITHSGCYYIADGETNYIRSGSTIHVEDNGGVLTITGTALALLDVETLISSSGSTWQNLDETGSCSFVEVTPAGGDEGIALTNVFSATASDLSTYGGTGYTITLKISTDGITATYNNTTYSYDYTGDGNFISIDFHTSEAALVAGTYNIVNYQSETVGDCIAGYEDPYFGSGGHWGSVWGTVASGVATDVYINSGTVVVAENAGTFTIKVNAVSDNGDVKATYTGAITIQ